VLFTCRLGSGGLPPPPFLGSKPRAVPTRGPFCPPLWVAPPLSDGGCCSPASSVPAQLWGRAGVSRDKGSSCRRSSERVVRRSLRSRRVCHQCPEQDLAPGRGFRLATRQKHEMLFSSPSCHCLSFGLVFLRERSRTSLVSPVSFLLAKARAGHVFPDLILSD